MFWCMAYDKIVFLKNVFRIVNKVSTMFPNIHRFSLGESGSCNLPQPMKYGWK